MCEKLEFLVHLLKFKYVSSFVLVKLRSVKITIWGFNSSDIICNEPILGLIWQIRGTT